MPRVPNISACVPVRVAAIVLAATLAAACALTAGGCADDTQAPVSATTASAASQPDVPDSPVNAPQTAPRLPEHESVRARQLAEAAMAQVGVTVGYDARYVPLSYPGGDVPLSTGACSDVIVRAFRKVGVDLQVKLHEDMTAHFSAYPQKWGLKAPDPNIDHRRVPNLAVYFRRCGKERPTSADGADYWPGDIVTWSDQGRPHVGIVSTVPAPDGTRFLMTHNIGAGAQTVDVLFGFPITGHYRYF